MKPKLFLLLLVLACSMIIIPLGLVLISNNDETTNNKKDVELNVTLDSNILVNVYRSNKDTIETYPLEEYVRGVVAAEMPIEFEEEALKAQAIAARTYIVKIIIEKNYKDVPAGAVVTDTVKHQVFISDEELKQLWGLNYNERISKLNKIINETNGQVITYGGQPIDALYFSTSNGYTENSEDYWEKEIPYLRSVQSSWDELSPKFYSTKLVPYSLIETYLNIDSSVFTLSNQEWIKIIETTSSDRVKEIKIGDKLFTGRDIRESFGLNSTSFTFELQEEGILFKTYGYGHGVGMSQYGANGMAQEGYTADEILRYYYTNANIEDIQKWIKPVSE